MKHAVLFMARRYPPSVGGMERFAFDLSTALESNENLYKITWGGSNKWLVVIFPWFFLRACWILLSKRDISVIHMQDSVQAPVGWLLHILFRKPYIVVAHGLDITYTKGFYQKLILPFVRRASMVASISSATHDEVLARGADPAKACVITLGTHDDYVTPSPDKRHLSELIKLDVTQRQTLLTTGRLVKRKGVAWFIQECLPQLAKSHPKILYLVAGAGEERAAIEQAIQDSAMAKYVVLLGRVSDEVRGSLYQSCDVFVMPNIVVPGDMEGFGMVAHEASTAELPVVASDLEGIKDAIIDNENGVLVKPYDGQAFVTSIELFLDSEEYRQSFGSKARAYTLDNYSWPRIAERYSEMYEQVVRKS